MDIGRGPEPESGLNLDRIVRTAIEVADAYGLDGLSMRRVATALGAGTMSLYRHVPGRAELVDLMVDVAFGEIHYPEPGPAGWRARIELAARQEWAMYRRHPWVLPIVAGTHRPPLGRNVLANIEWILSALDRHGLDPESMTQAYLTVSDYVQGAALYLRNEAEDERRTGVTSEQWWAARAESLTGLTATGQFPTLSRLLTAAPAQRRSAGKDFEFGLRRMLDGLAVLLGEATAGTSRGLSKVTIQPEFRPARPSDIGEIPVATAAALELLGRRWTTELLYLLSQGEARFGELARAIPGISRRILTERLRQLAEAGLVDRRDDAGRVTYALTERGAGLRGALEQIHAWAGTVPAPPAQADPAPPG
ncbi:hypothetical protein GCM10027280_03080 [Micromonospora polyrhachis]|uniref:DNA-binding HxlR family transcriptional regulator n=1 Tax=Micromonospora polyrhachis TaxID=1282883 RepID=A0A7W7WN20_9ACTN|nr:TetR/AcrR family transcriptional regulator C-terminal domain-containing protein [Micromonospora polyrhachis]MBB4957395.1 DNA-binding HxlR family transcriptional regulator [Micromonospora polyrhachis]